MRAWLLEELGQRGLDPQQYSHTLLALAERSCLCDCRWDTTQPPLKCEPSCHKLCQEERKRAVMECLSASCGKTAGLGDFVEEICSRLNAVQVEGHVNEAAVWESAENASITTIKAENHCPGTFCLPKFPPRLPTATNTSALDLEAEGFDSAFEDLEPDSMCSNSSGKRLYERGWESEESPLNSYNSSRESSEERSLINKKDKKERNNNDGAVTPILSAIEKATDLNLTPRITDAEDSDEFKTFCNKILSIAELWENAAGLKDSLASELFKLDNVSLSKRKQNDSPDFSVEFDLFSILSARTILKDTEEIGGSILAGVMCECPSSPKKTVYFSLPDKWFSFQGNALEEEKATPERNARRKLSFENDDFDDPVQIKCFKKVSNDDEDDDDDALVGGWKGIEPLNSDDHIGVKSESWSDSMWQVDAQNSLSPDNSALGAVSTVAEEMVRVILEDTPDGKAWAKWKEPDHKWKEADENKNNCAQQFVHHAQQSCFKTVLPGSTRYHEETILPQIDYYRSSESNNENLLISSRTHFKPINNNESQVTVPELSPRNMIDPQESGADVEEIEKDALESTEMIVSQVESEFEFLHSYSFESSPKCPSVIKRMLEPLQSSPDKCEEESTEMDFEGFSLPCGDRTQSKMSNIWKCNPDNDEDEGLFDYQRQAKWSTATSDLYEIEQAVPTQYLDDDLLMHTYALQQEISNNLPALPIDSDGRVLFSSELEEDWKQNSKPFSVQVPKKNKSRKVTANKKACHYFLGGGCARDLDCRYSHDPASITCRFWEQESCLKGITCEFLHAYNHSPVVAAPRRRQHSEGSNSRKRGAPKKHTSFEITSHTDFPELCLPEDGSKRGRGSTCSE